jgi:riboflavin kinase / FMN adenylyltransferase
MIATIGVFDGVHRGHEALLRTVLERSRDRGVEAIAITFEPHPVAVLAPRVQPHRIASRRIKQRLLGELGFPWVWELPFTTELAALSPREFIEELLLPLTPLEELWVGYDFRFGKGRDGDGNFLRREGARLGFEVQQFGAVHEGGRILSSTWVREALGRGAIEEAVWVLGHDFVLEGVVGYGQGRGSKEFVPTANLVFPPEQILPAYGVYAAWAELRGGLHPAAVSVGVRPTVAEQGRPWVEAHLIGWSGELRGEMLSLHFGTRLRPEEKFPTLEALKRAIEGDIRAATAYLEAHPPGFGS